MSRDTLIDFFDDLAKAHGLFLVHDDGFRTRSYSYEEVGRAARGFAARLADAGVRKGDTVLFWSENRPEWVVAFWGCLLGGIIVVPVDYRTSPDFLARISRTVAAKLALIGEDVPPVPAPLCIPIWKLHELEWRDGSLPTVAVSRDDVAEIMIASRLDVRVVPVRLEGVDRVLHRTWHMARPGHVRVVFGAPMRLRGADYAALANQVEDAVRGLLSSRDETRQVRPLSM